MAWKQGRVLIEATTAAEDSDPFRLAGPDLPANVVFDAQGAGEIVRVEIMQPDGTWATGLDQDGNELSITGANGTNIGIDVPGVFRASKDATLAAVGVNLSTASQPGYNDTEPQRATE